MNTGESQKSAMNSLCQRLTALTASLSFLALAPLSAAVNDFKIVKSTLPDGSAGSVGEVKFKPAADGKVIGVTWKDASGAEITGVAVPFPGTDFLAVASGADVLAVAIYQLQKNGDIDARWALYQEGAAIGSYKATKGSEKGAFAIEGGGTLKVELGKGRSGKATWALATGAYSGIAVADGDFLAAISIKPGGQGAVGIYRLNREMGDGTGRWSMTGLEGAGEVQFQSATAVSSPAPPTTAVSSSADPAAAAQPEAEVSKLAAQLMKDTSLLAGLRPSPAEIREIAADAASAQALQDYVEMVYGKLGEISSLAKPGQTEILVSKGDGLPGGYEQQGSHFRPGIAIYGFEYVVPGETAGMAYDGLVKVNGRWVLIPKAWRAFDK
jgi:hypothetical protein